MSHSFSRDSPAVIRFQSMKQSNARQRAHYSGRESGPPRRAEDDWDSVELISSHIWGIWPRTYTEDGFQAVVDEAIAFLAANQGLFPDINRFETAPRVLVAAIDRPTCALRVLPCRNEYFIALDAGLVDLIRTLTELSLWRTDFAIAEPKADEQGMATGAYRTQLDEATVDRVLRSIFAVLKISGGVGLPFHLRIEPKLRPSVDELTRTAIEFILLHELSHIFLGHMPTGEPHPSDPNDELGADTMAAWWMMQLARFRDDLGIGTLAAILVAGRSISLMQAAGAPVEAKSHVSSMQRARFITDILGEFTGAQRVQAASGLCIELDRFSEAQAANTWVPASRNHLINCLPRRGFVDLVVDYGNGLVEPVESDVFLISFLCDTAERDYRQRSLSQFSQAVRLGASISGDVFDRADSSGHSDTELSSKPANTSTGVCHPSVLR